MVNYLNKASWLDAEHYCTTRGSHLWSINSFDEWYNIFQAVQHTSMFEIEKSSTTNFIMVSTLLFIGLTQNNFVSEYLKILILLLSMY